MKKREVLMKLVDLNELQADIVSGEYGFDEDAFQQNVDDKAELIEDLEKLDGGFNALFERVKEQLEGNKEAYKDEITVMQELIREITELAAKVETKEKQNKALIQNQFLNMRKEIHNAKRSTQMANTYYKNMNKLNFEPQFMDKKE